MFVVRVSELINVKHLEQYLGASLVVQWLRIHLPTQGTQVQALVWELRPHIPCGN